MSKIRNTAEDYLTVRVCLVHVQKKFGGLKDKAELGRIVMVPDTWKDAKDIFVEIKTFLKSKGVTVET